MKKVKITSKMRRIGKIGGIFEMHNIYPWLNMIDLNQWHGQIRILTHELNQGWGFRLGRIPEPLLFHWIRILPLTTVLSNYFHFEKKIKQESTNSSLKWWLIWLNFMPNYLKYKYISFFQFELTHKNFFFGSSSLNKRASNILFYK